MPVAFSVGAEHGRIDVKAPRLGAHWLHRGASDVYSANYTGSIGLGGTEHRDSLPDTRFHTSLLAAQWLHEFAPHDGALYLRGEWQNADQALLSLERFSIGGLDSVRGYRRVAVLSDNGWSASIEYRLPIAGVVRPAGAIASLIGGLTLVAFVDAGRGWNVQDPTDHPHTLLAAGPGLRWDAAYDLHAELYWGALRRHLPDAGGDIQDQGIHFVLSSRRGF